MKNKSICSILVISFMAVLFITGCKKKEVSLFSAVGEWTLISINSTSTSFIGGLGASSDTTISTYNNSDSLFIRKHNGTAQSTSQLSLALSLNSNGNATLKQTLGNVGGTQYTTTYEGTWDYLSSSQLNDAIHFGGLTGSVLNSGGYNEGIFKLSSVSDNDMTLNYHNQVTSNYPYTRSSNNFIYNFSK